MKIRADRDALAAGLKQVSPALGKVAVHKALNGVRLTRNGDTIEATCTDLALSITARIPGSIDTDDPIIIPAGPLERIVKALPAGAVEIVADDDIRATVTAGDTTATLHLHEPGAWPAARIIETEPVTLTDRDLHQLARMAPMASVDEKRQSLRSVWIGGREAMASDSYRGGICDLETALPWECQVPAEALKAVLRDADGPVTVACDSNAGRFTTDTVTWTVALIEEEFPASRMHGLFPAAPPHRWTFEPLALADTISRVQSLTSNEALRINVHGQQATLSRAADGLGEIAATIPVDSNWDATIGVNPEQLAAAIKAAETDELHLLLVDQLKPITIPGPGLKQLLMPVRLTEVKR